MALLLPKLKRSVNQTSGIFDKFVYRPGNSDTIADMVVPGYFDNADFFNANLSPAPSLVLVDVYDADDDYAVLEVTSSAIRVLISTKNPGSVLSATDDTEQTLTDVAIANKEQITFGAAQTALGLDADGTYTVPVGGRYKIDVRLNLNVGTVTTIARTWAYCEKDSVQLGESYVYQTCEGDQLRTLSFSIEDDLLAGEELKFYWFGGTGTENVVTIDDTAVGESGATAANGAELVITYLGA